MHFAGIDIGSSSVKLVVLDEAGERLYASRRVHQGMTLSCVRSMLDGVADAYGDALCVCTGSAAELVRAHAPNVGMLQDVPAIVSGVAHMAPQAASVISMGAQSAVFVASDSRVGAQAAGAAQAAAAAGEGTIAPAPALASPFASGVPEFSMNESCAAGTGSFFEDQMERLGLPLEDYSRLVARAQSVPSLSGRCSVFAKTDIIHHQQEGVPVEDILLGLCFATVRTYKATIVRGRKVPRPVALVGGTLLNAGVVRAIREVFKLEEGELICDEELLFAQATGAALEARAACGSDGACACVRDVRLALDGGAQTVRAQMADDGGADGTNAALASTSAASASDELVRLPALSRLSCEPRQGFELAPVAWDASAPVPCALGVDVGSTSTNLVLVGLDGALLDAQYLRTRGNPKAAVREGLASLAARVGTGARVVAVGTTGSGRTLIGEMIGADVVRDEITAQARAAVAADPSVDTVFEIGGQDSKYISISAGQVADFQMNKVCAAGTGSFIEEQAGRLGVPLADYGPVAFSSDAPVDLGERCTVFVQTAINAALARGASTADVAAGLCLSIVRNYLHKVVGTKPVGKRIVLQGGVAYNPAIEAAFRAYAGDGLTVNPHFAVSGAVGVALLALEAACAQEAPSAADAQEAVGAAGAGVPDVPDALGAPAEPSFAAARFATSTFKGFDLSGAAHVARTLDPEAIAANRAFFRRTDELFLEGYDPVRDPAKKTVGVPRCLMVHKLFPMINGFFRALGYNVHLTDASNADTIRLAQRYAQGETCYPVKLVHGHMAQLLDAGVDYVFMPSMHTIRHAKSTVAHNYACIYMQDIAPVVAQELDYAGHGITLLSPLMNMDFGQSAMAEALLGVGAQLGHSPQESARAMLAGGFAVQEFTRKTEELGDELLASLEPGERVMVIVTRNYGIVDPALNMGIPDLLLDRGQKVITISHLHAHDVDLQADHGDMYWPFGQHMLSSAKLIARDPRLFAVYLTNHGCGPDTMVSHQVREEMGDKPYLQIEMDEHFSKVGVETRVEAFLNAIAAYEARDERHVPISTRVVNLACTPVHRGQAACVGMPSFGPYGPLVAAWLSAAGTPVRLLHPSAETLALGRAQTTSKEYYTFASLLGMCLAAVRQGADDDENSTRLTQLLVPGSQGGEADGQYARTIRTILDEQGAADVSIAAPTLELLACTLSDADGFFLRILAGDVVQAAPPNAREGLLERLCAPELSLDEVCAAAREVVRARADEPAPAATLALVGEWPLVAGDELVGGIWTQLEREGFRVKRAPMAEYFWMLWQDCCRESECEKSSAPMPMMGEKAAPDSASAHVHEGDADGCDACGAGCATIGGLPFEVAAHPLLRASEPTLPQDEWSAALERYAAWMAQVHEALGDASAFSDDAHELLDIATSGVRLLAGAGARYRFAKATQASRAADGVIMAASAYENVDTLLRLQGVPAQAPVLHLSFDGALDAGVEERLRAFLYYL